MDDKPATPFEQAAPSTSGGSLIGPAGNVVNTIDANGNKRADRACVNDLGRDLGEGEGRTGPPKPAPADVKSYFRQS
jgi:hypothetical protein